MAKKTSIINGQVVNFQLTFVLNCINISFYYTETFSKTCVGVTVMGDKEVGSMEQEEKAVTKGETLS